jgi:hypothetical protein
VINWDTMRAHAQGISGLDRIHNNPGLFLRAPAGLPCQACNSDREVISIALLDAKPVLLCVACLADAHRVFRHWG